MVQVRNFTGNTVHRKVLNQTSTEPKSSQLAHVTEQSKRKTTNDNFETSQRKKSKQDDLSSNQTASSIYIDPPSNSTTFAHAEFTPYRARRSRNIQKPASQRKPSQTLSRKQQTNMKHVRSNDHTDFDDDDQENNLNFGSNQYIQPDHDENDLDELQFTQKQSRIKMNHYADQNKLRSLNPIDEEDIPDANDEDEEGVDTNESELVYQIYFNEKFDQLRADLANTTNTLAGDVQTQLIRIDKQLKSLSKTVQDHSVNSTLAVYQNLSVQHPKVVEFNGANLLSICKTTDYKKCARTIMKLLFSADELSNSILYANPIYSRPGLDPNRMAIWEEAVCARFKIDQNRFEDFFRICLRRTLSQMLCDIRRDRRRTLMNNAGQRRSSLASMVSSVGPNASTRTATPGVLRSREGLVNRNVLD